MATNSNSGMTITNEDVKEALVNEYRDICTLCTQNVKITRIRPQDGSLLLLKINVYARTHYLTDENDTTPKETDNIELYLKVRNGYPKVAPTVYYAPGKRLASVNVFSNGTQCIDNWVFDEINAAENTSLVGAVEKTLRDIIHDPSVTRYDSMANRSLERWQKNMLSKGRFPTCSPSRIFREQRDIVVKTVPMPSRVSSRPVMYPAAPMPKRV